MLIKKIMYKLLGGTRFARFYGAHVGEGCRILTDRLGSEPWLISIGDHVTVSSGVTFINHDGVGWLFSDENGRRFKYARIDVGHSTFIGANSTLLPGVSIGSNCVIGAGSVVAKSIPAGSVAAGNPARIVGSYEQLIDKVKDWKSKSSMVGSTYADRVNSILDSEMKPEMQAALQSHTGNR